MLVATIGNIEIQLEEAVTPSEKIRGLSLRNSLAPGTGFLIQFPSNRIPTIQTKFMLFDLDLVFIDKKGIVTDVVSPAPAGSEALYSSEKSMYVIEMNYKEAERLKISKGMHVSIPGKTDILSATKSAPKSRKNQLKSYKLVNPPIDGEDNLSFKNGGELAKEEELHILDKKGNTQKIIPVKSRIISRKETVALFKLATLKPTETTSKALGKLIVQIINGQNSRPNEYV